ncbi:MAG: zinc-ribbon domain-containing protein [Bacteroidetes bacterium]|nr:zinc-ribbon domain-containing protein [Bacteroidota bacterium]MBT6687860.1 zinc-ribbon domain-containing protein [Bacteroidota bacterium]MBT7142072.1 zinc-ribbon domain-containing protein [Bacteroidota bacterium]MBT7492343.1 zinc-ribbon domain-containing protein [Bacteroidota bacterium]
MFANINCNKISYSIDKDNNISDRSDIEQIELCKNCNNRLDEGFVFCPYCGIQ